MIKFVSRYDEEVHEFLASKDYGPQASMLKIYYGPLPGAPPSPPRPKNAPAGMAFGFMQMVVMGSWTISPPLLFHLQMLINNFRKF